MTTLSSSVLQTGGNGHLYLCLLQTYVGSSPSPKEHDC